MAAVVTLLTLVQYLMVTSLFGGLTVSVLQQKASSVSSLQSLCTFCTFSRGACTCGGGDVTCVRQLSSARPRVCVCEPPSHDTKTVMAAVGFCGDWFIFTCDTKLVAVHSKQSRSE